MTVLDSSASLPSLTLISQGKVRDIYATSSDDHLLFVASDRISAYDVVLRNVGQIFRAMKLLTNPRIGNSRQGKTFDADFNVLVR